MIPLAHAGGLDEIAFMLLPAAVIFVVLQFRRKHLEAEDAAEAKEQTEEAPGR